MKMYAMIVMLRLHQTNSGALNTMVALKWNGNGEIDILVTILVCWRLVPYVDPDQQGDKVFKNLLVQWMVIWMYPYFIKDM